VNPHLSRARLRYFALYNFKVRSRLWHLHGFHFCYLSSPLISIPSKWNLRILMSSERNIANVGWVCLSESAPVGPGPDIDIGDTFLHRLQS